VLFFTGFGAHGVRRIAKEQLKETPKRKAELGTMLQMVDRGKRKLSPIRIDRSANSGACSMRKLETQKEA